MNSWVMQLSRPLKTCALTSALYCPWDGSGAQVLWVLQVLPAFLLAQDAFKQNGRNDGGPRRKLFFLSVN